MQKQGFSVLCKKQGFSLWRKAAVGKLVGEIHRKKVDRLAQLLNFTGFALYAIRCAVNFGEINLAGPGQGVDTHSLTTALFVM